MERRHVVLSLFDFFELLPVIIDIIICVINELLTFIALIDLNKGTYSSITKFYLRKSSVFPLKKDSQNKVHFESLVVFITFYAKKSVG